MEMFKKVQEKILKIDNHLIFDKDTDLQSSVAKKFMPIFTELGSSVVIFIFLGIVCLLDNYQLAFIFYPIYLFQLVVIEAIKRIFSRARPKSYIQKNILGFRSKSGSFPSGHTSNVFCVAFILCTYYQTPLIITILAYLIASNVALSRILLGKHYFIDVIAGALLGILLAMLGSYLWIQIYTNTDLIRIHF